jgi:bifunctional non-homologous end joining protein LigD
MAGGTTRRSKASRELEKQLARYRSMRDFDVTAEPRGGKVRKTAHSAGFPFVIQKHAATRLHYDFRLAWDGVLKSWAVTKGPSLYPGDKRLAVQVEDHPLEYGDFEGTIPKGQYGGGTVMVWDYGTWKPLVDANAGLAKGDLKFELDGTKLKGSWVLARMRTRDERPDKPNWLLIKHRDEFARAETALAITDEAPDSAVSSRTMQQIAKDNDRTWHSNRPPDQQPGVLDSKSTDNGRPAVQLLRLPSLASKAEESFPGFIEPQLANESSSPPGGSDWIHELKLDGYRIQIQIRKPDKKIGGHQRVALLTRKGLNWTAKMPIIAHAAESLPVQSAILDGEAVVLDETGTSSFSDLQAAFQGDAHLHLLYFAFDLLHLNGHNLRGLPLLRRKEFLAILLSNSGEDSVIRLSEHFKAHGAEVFRKACDLGAEGIVSKLASAPYSSGRGNLWLKSKCSKEHEFVIGGFTQPSHGGPGIGAILLGYYEGGKLRYAGRSGTGFTQHSQKMLRQHLDKLAQDKSPFAEVPKEAAKGANWIKPALVARIAFANWTHDNILRQASFKGLRDDKPANEVVREVAVTPEGRDAKSPDPTSPGPTRVRLRLGLNAAKSPSSTRMRPRLNLVRTSRANLADLAITHPDKVLDESSGMTKEMLARYYVAVADHMLPHVAQRPLSVVRCPEGSGKPCFFQKHIASGLPDGIKSIPVPDKKTGKTEDYLTLNTAGGLVGLAQLGVLEIHPWGSRNDSLEKPDRIVFDLDPDAAIDWKTLTATAVQFRNRLESVGLRSFVKTTGGKGLHIVAPILAEHPWSVAKGFAHALVLEMEKKTPNLYVTKMTKAIRKDRIFLDYLRNDRGSTAVAPFSPRARARIPVAVPLHWRELSSKTRPVFAVSDFPSWKKRLEDDPWSEMTGVKQRLTTRALSEFGIRL